MVADEDVRVRRAAGGKESIGHPNTHPPKAKEGYPSFENDSRERARADSDSVSSSEKILVKESGKQVSDNRWIQDRTFDQFVAAYREAKPDLIDSDFADAHFAWRVMDFEQRLKATDAIKARITAGLCRESQYVKLPKNFLNGEYERPIVQRKVTKTEELEAYWRQ